MASIAIMIGGAILNATAFIGGSYIAKSLSSSNYSDAERKRHDLALEKYNKDWGTYQKKKQEFENWQIQRKLEKNEADISFQTTDEALKYYNKTHKDKMVLGDEPDFTNYYQPNQDQKNGELLYVGGGMLAVWCATSGCGVSLNEEYPKIIQDFLNFHVYFTTRRILYEMSTPLPGDSIFKQIGNRFNEVAFLKLCQEFNLPNNPDFRFRGGKNHGLGTIFINGSIPPIASGLAVWPNSTPIFHDERGIGGVNGKIVNIFHDSKPYEWFSPDSGKGLTKAGMGRLNRSVEAFVYCIVGSEVNIRSSIISGGGGGQETQQEMLKLFEESIIENDIAKSASQ